MGKSELLKNCGTLMQLENPEICFSQKTYNHPEIGHTVKRIITPYAAAAAQKHYGCPGLDGPELEDGGGEGTAGSHWEQRTFMNEYMTGTSVEFPVVSDITLALFKDTGWYDISPSAYKKLAPLLWGKNMYVLKDSKNLILFSGGAPS